MCEVAPHMSVTASHLQCIWYSKHLQVLYDSCLSLYDWATVLEKVLKLLRQPKNCLAPSLSKREASGVSSSANVLLFRLLVDPANPNCLATFVQHSPINSTENALKSRKFCFLRAKPWGFLGSAFWKTNLGDVGIYMSYFVDHNHNTKVTSFLWNEAKPVQAFRHGKISGCTSNCS